MTSQADRERFAPLFGWNLYDWYCPYCRVKVPSIAVTFSKRHDERAGGCGRGVEEPPDFLDPQGEYFGPAVIKLLDAGWVPKGKMIVDADCVARYSWVRGLEIISDPNPVRATMLALEKQRAMEEGK